MPDIDRTRLPFREQIDFFRQKLNLPTERWDDIWTAAHDRAFIVAGAQSADLLDDLRNAVDGAIANGDTIQTFRQNFRAIVARNGWTGWTGEGTRAGEAWRTKVIYNTNIATSYAAGRWQQLHDPDLLKVRPYWRYIHNDSVSHPRPQHKAWGDAGLTLRYDDAFWQTHYPPNGWGCRCRVKAVRGQGKGDATEPPAGWDQRDAKGRLPGIDRGWDYAPGANADTSLRELVQQKLIGYPPAIGKALTRDVNKYIDAHSDVAGFVKTALAGDATGDLWLGFVDNPALGASVERDLSHYLVLLPPDGVRHVRNSHGRDAGMQRPPTPEDYASAMAWLATPDAVTPGKDTGPNGEPRLLVRKRLGDETFESVWEVRPGHRNRALALVSMWVIR